MREVVLIDTSVLCHLLDVPNKGGKQAEVIHELKRLQGKGATLVIPLTAVIETGNHVAQNGDGRQRRAAAQRFARLMGQAARGEQPFTLHPLDRDRVLALLDGFTDHATRGVGMGDQTIIDAWTDTCALLPTARVRVWSFDQDLAGYDREP
jgi:hypothetical protein